MAKKTAVTKKAKTERLPREAKVLQGAGPDKNTLTIIAALLKNGQARTQVIHRQGDERKRGMIETFETFAAAAAHARELVAQAIKIGWTAKTRAAKEPAFSTLPKPNRPLVAGPNANS